MKKIFLISAISLLIVSINYGQNMKLVVGDQIKIKGGTPGANKLLTSDANGLAIWSSLESLNIPNISIDSLVGAGFRSSSSNTNTYKLIFADQDGNIVTRIPSNCMQSNIFPWALGGNTLITGQPDYIGTCNEYPFRLFTNGQESMRITTDGKVGIGTTTPQQKFEVYDTELPAYGRFGNINGYTEIGYNSAHAIIESSNDLLINYNSAENVYIATNTTENGPGVGNLLVGGKIGIGTDNPVDERKLHILDVSNISVDGHPAGLRIEQHLLPADTWSHWDMVVNDGSLYFNNNPTQTGVEALSSSAITINSDGKVGIGTTVIPEGYKFAIVGKTIASDEVTIQLQEEWDVPDFVFAKDYKLMPLKELESYLIEHKHLPEIPSASDIKTNGIPLAEMSFLLLKKIEELTLFAIEQNKKIEEQQQKIMELENKVNAIKK